MIGGLTGPASNRIGPYTIDREIGRGGMGVVYLGHDTRLDRAVAIKALPEHLGADADRLARFEREARVLAQLNHPNVAGIYGVEEQNGQRYLILEYVEGETLEHRLDRGALPVDEAIEVAAQVASGIEAAHEAGVIHRDLKPGNVKLTPDGKVKVLDFGLARNADTGSTSSSVVASESPTMTSPVQLMSTNPGAILGTAPYMSPEQARGRHVDKRTDIWSFGVILYEMLTGAGPFHGETATDCIGAILHKEIDLDRLPKGMPAHARHVLHRCLERDRSRRYRDIGDVLIDLEQPARPDTPDAGATGSRRGMLPWVIAVVALVIALGAVLRGAGHGSALTERPVACFEIRADISPLVIGRQFAISAEGRAVAFIDSRGRVLLRHIESFEPVLLHDAHDARAPFFSPDGAWIGFWSEGLLKKIPSEGGRPIAITRCGPVRGAAWGANDDIAFSEAVGNLKVVSANGGEVSEIWSATDSRQTWIEDPQFLPRNRAIIIGSGRGIEVVDRDTGERRTILDDGTRPRFVEPDHLIYMRAEGTIWTRRLDTKSLTLVGEPSLLMREQAEAFDVASDGSLVFVPSTGAGAGTLVLVDREGSTEALAFEEAAYHAPRLTADGRRIAVAVESRLTQAAEIWILDRTRGVRRRLAHDGFARWPVWAHAGARLIHCSFIGDGSEIIERAVDGSGEPGRIGPAGSYPIPMSWCESRELLAYYDYGRQADIWILAPGKDAEPFIVTDADERSPVFSPDGDWLAFVSDETGRDEIHVCDFPGADTRIIVSRTGGSEPTWSRDGDELFYRQGSRMMAVRFDPAASDPFATPVELFDDPRLAANPVGRGNPNFDVTADGRFLMVQRREADELPKLRVILHWFEDARSQ